MALYTIRPLVGWVGPTTPHRQPMTVRVDRLRDDPAAQRAAHGQARRRVHPDVGGDHETWHEVEQAAATLGLL